MDDGSSLGSWAANPTVETAVFSRSDGLRLRPRHGPRAQMKLPARRVSTRSHRPARGWQRSRIGSWRMKCCSAITVWTESDCIEPRCWSELPRVPMTVQLRGVHTPEARLWRRWPNVSTHVVSEILRPIASYREARTGQTGVRCNEVSCETHIYVRDTCRDLRLRRGAWRRGARRGDARRHDHRDHGKCASADRISRRSISDAMRSRCTGRTRSRSSVRSPGGSVRGRYHSRRTTRARRS